MSSDPSSSSAGSDPISEVVLTGMTMEVTTLIGIVIGIAFGSLLLWRCIILSRIKWAMRRLGHHQQLQSNIHNNDDHESASPYRQQGGSSDGRRISFSEERAPPLRGGHVISDTGDDGIDTSDRSSRARQLIDDDNDHP
jgi:hypothetical protein